MLLNKTKKELKEFIIIFKLFLFGLKVDKTKTTAKRILPILIKQGKRIFIN